MYICSRDNKLPVIRQLTNPGTLIKLRVAQLLKYFQAFYGYFYKIKSRSAT